jgi:glucosylceramidase
MKQSFIKSVSLAMSLLYLTAALSAQSFTRVVSTEGKEWQVSVLKTSSSTSQQPLLNITGAETGTPFNAWGTCFNELGWDALNRLPR